MENSTIEVITLDQVEVRNLPELQGWKEKQQKIVAEHPFIGIEDNKSYEEAKKHRTALVSARTDIQKQDRLIASKLKELRTESGKVAAELIAITQPHEEKQQEEVKRYEAEREAKRLEEERIEKERKEAIQKSVVEFYTYWKKQISCATIENLELSTKDVLKSIEEESEKDFEEFELDFAEKCNLLKDQLKERTQYLKEQEEARKEREKLAAERAELERQKKEAEEQRAKEEAERKAREEKERAAREKEEKKIREEREAEAEKLRKERAEIEAEKEKMVQESFNSRMEKLKDLGFLVAHTDQIVNDEYNIVLDQFEDDVYNATPDEFEAILNEARTHLAEEKEAWEKQQQEEKARKEAEAKRLEELKPDKEKTIEYLKSFFPSKDFPELSDSKVTNVLKGLIQSHDDWKASAIDRIQNLK